MQNRLTAALAAAACVLFLAACGGGGGGGSPSAQSPSLTRSGAQTIASGHALDAAQRAATAMPRFGSVTQSTGAGDRASASLTAGPRLQVNIARGAGGTIALDTAAHAVSPGLTASPVTGRAAADSYLLRYDSSSFTLARVGAEWDPGYGGWLAGGYWLHAMGDIPAGRITAAEAGAFMDGPEIRGTPSLPVTGTASYRGIAAGFYASQYGTDIPTVPSGSREVGEFDGVAALTTDFGARTIWGRISNIRASGVIAYPNGTAEGFNVTTDYQVQLAPAQVGSNGTFTSSGVTVSHPLVSISSRGAWGGRFSTIDDSAGNPRLVAGTVGASGSAPGGSTASFVGGFYGVTPQFR